MKPGLAETLKLYSLFLALRSNHPSPRLGKGPPNRLNSREPALPCGRIPKLSPPGLTPGVEQSRDRLPSWAEAHRREKEVADLLYPTADSEPSETRPQTLRAGNCDVWFTGWNVAVCGNTDEREETRGKRLSSDFPGRAIASTAPNRERRRRPFS